MLQIKNNIMYLDFFLLVIMIVNLNDIERNLTVIAASIFYPSGLSWHLFMSAKLQLSQWHLIPVERIFSLCITEIEKKL